MRLKYFAAAAAVLPLLSGAALMAQDIEITAAYLFGDLTGAAETGGGDKDGFGDFAATVKFDEGKFCYVLSVGDISKPTAAHVHAGKAGVNGDPVITISVTGEDDEACVDADKALLKKIADNPGDYYVNVHTADHPAGAIRGQLQE